MNVPTGKLGGRGGEEAGQVYVKEKEAHPQTSVEPAHSPPTGGRGGGPVNTDGRV